MLSVARMIALLAACTCGSGCAAGKGATKHDDQRPQEDLSTAQPAKPVLKEETFSAPVVVKSALPEQPVREGTAPLIYLLPASGSVRIMDKTMDKELAAVSVEARSIIRIDDLTGISLGKETLLRGPLPAGREYQIYLSTGSGNTVERTVTSPGR
ncbi:MAG: hypothetical protein WBD40_05610 [Tepidisphaeraceae bacterium]